MWLTGYKNTSKMEMLFGETFEETGVIYRDDCKKIVGEAIVMVLDFKKELGHEFIEAKAAVELFEDWHQGRGWNRPTPSEYLHSFLRDINFENRKELHERRFAFISHIEVYRDHRGKGWGKEILKMVIDSCKEDGVEAVFLSPSPFGKGYEEKEAKVQGSKRLYDFYSAPGFEEYVFGGKNPLCDDHQAYMVLPLSAKGINDEKLFIEDELNNEAHLIMDSKEKLNVKQKEYVFRDDLPF